MGLQTTCSDANSFYFQLERITKDRSLFCNSTCEPWKSLGLRGGEHEGFFGLQAEKTGLKHIWVFPNIGVPQNGWFTMENPVNVDVSIITPPPPYFFFSFGFDQKGGGVVTIVSSEHF